MLYDLAIIGGGPAGAAAGVYASRKRLKTVFITKDWVGQSTVSEKIENWIGTIAISGPELSTSLENHVKAYADDIIDFKEGELATLISKNGNNFTVTTTKGSYDTRSILITAGSHRRKIDIPGADIFENRGLTYCATCDGPMYSDQDVAVIGGGNAAFDGAAQLLAYCKSVTLLNRSGEFRADPSTVETLLANPKMKAVKFASPKEVKGDKFVNGLVYTDTMNNVDVHIPVTGIFVEVGSLPNTDFAADLIKLDEFKRIVTDPRNQRASVKGVWAAGDCTDGLFHQNNIAAGDAVKALEDIYLYLSTSSH